MLPRLLDADLHAIRTLHPVFYTLNTQLKPLSTAQLGICDTELPIRAFVELFSIRGSEGVFRVSALSTDDCGLTEVTLQHGLCTLADHMHPGKNSQAGNLRTLLTKLLSNQTRWVLGDCDVPDTQELTWKISNSNDLQSLLDIMAELPAYRIETDQSALPWVLHIRALPTEVGCECRIDRNLTAVQIDYDDSDMCTRAYADGLSKPMEADTIGTWGAIERHVSVDERLGSKIIQETVSRYLEKAKNPKATITLTVQELSRLTGEPFDAFREGMLCRCILPDMTTMQRIVGITRPDPIGEPEHAVLTLASVLDDLSITVAGLVVDTRLSLAGLGQMEKELRIQAETIDVLAQDINVVTQTLSVQAEQIAAKANRIDLETERLRINALETEIAGLVTMEEFEAIQGWSTEFAGESISGSSIVGGYGDFDELVCGQFNGASPTWESQYVLTGIGTISQSKRYLSLMTADGGTVALDIVTDVSISPSGRTISYLASQ